MLSGARGIIPALRSVGGHLWPSKSYLSCTPVAFLPPPSLPTSPIKPIIPISSVCRDLIVTIPIPPIHPLLSMHLGGIFAAAIPAHLAHQTHSAHQTHYPYLQCVSQFDRDNPNPAHSPSPLHAPRRHFCRRHPHSPHPFVLYAAGVPRELDERILLQPQKCCPVPEASAPRFVLWAVIYGLRSPKTTSHCCSSPWRGLH